MDRLAIVTGTSRGIGAAVAVRLLERGSDVVGIARHPAPIPHPHYRHLNIDLENASALAAFRARCDRPGVNARD